MCFTNQNQSWKLKHLKLLQKLYAKKYAKGLLEQETLLDAIKKCEKILSESSEAYNTKKSHVLC